VSDTEVSELDPRERETLPPPVRSLEEMLDELQATVAEANAESLRAVEASNRARTAAERCAALSLTLSEQLRRESAARERLEHRVQRIELHLGLAAE